MFKIKNWFQILRNTVTVAHGTKVTLIYNAYDIKYAKKTHSLDLE